MTLYERNGFRIGQKVVIIDHSERCWLSHPQIRQKHIGAAGIIERIWDDDTYGVSLTPTQSCMATVLTAVRKRGRPRKITKQ